MLKLQRKGNTNMSELKFKNLIWSEEGKSYLKTFYFKDEIFFTAKGNKNSDCYYVNNNAVSAWIDKIVNYYDPYDVGDDKTSRNQLKKDLFEKRGGQFSNGTLFSSSRFVAELFKTKEARANLLKLLGVKDDPSFKWTLEYRLPIKNLPRPAQMDLVAESDDVFIGIESKMKEIYSNHKNLFSLDYENETNHHLKEFNNVLGIDLVPVKEKGKIIYYHQAKISGYENCNFYYKQQICHLLGIRQKQAAERNKRKRYIFINLVFDPRAISKNENKQIEKYLSNEDAVMSKLKQFFDETNIEYKGVVTQRDILK